MLERSAVPRGRPIAAVAIFIVLALVGVYLAKWHPYFFKSIKAAQTHALGASLISGKASAPPVVGWSAAVDYTLVYFKDIWQALIVGLVLGAGVQVLLPRDWLLRVLGRSNLGSAARAAAVAVPGMMCTCCSAPIAVGLAKSRVSSGAVLAFWVGSPMLNPATMIFMGFVLGWGWVGLRIVFALLLVFGIAHLADRYAGHGGVPQQAQAAAEASAAVPEGSMAARYLRAIWRLAIGLVPEYFVIVVVLGAVRAWLFPAMSPAIGQSILVMLLLAIGGTLFVIPTAGEIPIVQVLQSYGLGAAGSGALLTALPAVSLPSLAMVGRALPAKLLVYVFLAVVAGSVLSGLAALALGL